MHQVVLPQSGTSSEEAAILTWFRREGDADEKGDALLEGETEKAVMEVESPASGVLRKILVPEGETVSVLTPIALIGEPDEPIDATLVGSAEQHPPQPAPSGQGPVAGAASVSEQAPARVPPSGRIIATPAARKLAEQEGVELAGLRGRGPGGRIVLQDVREAAPGAAAGAGAPGPAAAERLPTADQVTPFSPMRRAIARRLTESKQAAPHFYVTVEIDMTDLLRTRQAAIQSAREKVSVNAVILKATALALRDNPRVNTTCDGQNIITHADINVGFAVPVEDGLLVPVIANCDRRSLAEISQEAKRLAGLAQQGKLAATAEGTFTVSNMGMLGVDNFTAVINQPECAILAVGQAADRLLMTEAGVVNRKLMKVTLSCDHRVIDGLTAAKFLNRLKVILEEPEQIFRQA